MLYINGAMSILGCCSVVDISLCINKYAVKSRLLAVGWSKSE